GEGEGPRRRPPVHELPLELARLRLPRPESSKFLSQLVSVAPSRVTGGVNPLLSTGPTTLRTPMDGPGTGRSGFRVERRDGWMPPFCKGDFTGQKGANQGVARKPRNFCTFRCWHSVCPGEGSRTYEETHGHEIAQNSNSRRGSAWTPRRRCPRRLRGGHPRCRALHDRVEPERRRLRGARQHWVRHQLLRAQRRESDHVVRK